MAIGQILIIGNWPNIAEKKLKILVSAKWYHSIFSTNNIVPDSIQFNTPCLK